MQSSTPLRVLNRGVPPVTPGIISENIFVASPLRRSLARQSVLQSAINQDDDSERLARRSAALLQRQITNTSVASASPKRQKEIKEHFQFCVKLFMENKITTKNVWNLQFIENIDGILKTEKNPIDQLQVGGISIEVAAKIYGIKVDDMHTKALQMSQNLARMIAKPTEVREQNHNVDENGDNNDNVAQKNKTKRKKSKSCNNIKDVQSLEGQISKIHNNYFQNGSGSSNPSDLFTNMIPIHPLKHYFVNLSDESMWFSKQDKRIENSDEECHKTYSWPLKPSRKNNPNICLPFSDFEIDNWDPDNDATLMHITSFQDEVVFDDKGNPIPELDAAPQEDIFNDPFENHVDNVASSEDEEEKEKENRINFPTEFVTDFRPENRITEQGEFSFANVNNSVLQAILAGPSHWKLKHIKPRESKFSGVVEREKRQKKKGKDDEDLFVSLTDFNDFTPPSEKYKPRKKPIKYDFNKVFHPPVLIDEKYVLKDKIAWVAKPGMFFNLPLFCSTENLIEKEVEPYNYDNPLDAQYCSQHNLSKDESSDDGGDIFSQEVEIAVERQSLDKDPENVADVGNLLKDNLVEPPQMVKKDVISYALQPKKLNMKKMKEGVWMCLVTKKDEPNIKHLAKEEVKLLPVIPTKFSEIRERLPQVLPNSMKKDTSTGSAFVALLHLANENNLKLTQKTGNLFDFLVTKETKIKQIF